MSDPIANRTLELACTVGAMDDAVEAIEDGADVNFQSGSPLFMAIVNRHREMINLLLDHGADGECYIAKKLLTSIKTRDDLVEELIACAPHNPKDIKMDQITEIDNGIRDSGVQFLLSDLDWDKATLFRDSLDAIGAGTSHRCVAEFLQWARSERGTTPNQLPQFLSHYDSAIDEYRERYLSSGEDLVALASNFLSDDEASSDS